MRHKVILLLATVLVVLSSCITDDDEEDFYLVPGDSVPQFSVRMNDEDGTTLGTQDLMGKVGVIVFFHTDCPDCQKELPVIQRVYDTYKDRPDVLLLCISRAESSAEIRSYWEKHSITLPFSAQEDDGVFSLFASRTIPRVFISDRDAVIRSVYTDDPLATYEQIVKDIDAYLPE